eukprot:GEMP01006292.1.p1 GENE.GEMP01006292.1~~GEMP01006292.1.p1  ORF type:complete len:785 (+),score=213.83 GEMP01006292.1:76-2430(+)
MTKMGKDDEMSRRKLSHDRALLREVTQENCCIQKREYSARDDDGPAGRTPRQALGPTICRGAVKYQPCIAHVEAQRGGSKSPTHQLRSCSPPSHRHRIQNCAMDALLGELDQYDVCREMRIKFSKRQARISKLLDTLYKETENFREYRLESEESGKVEGQRDHVQSMHWDERMCANLMANPSKLHSSCSSALCQSEDFQWSPWLDEGTPPLQVVARDILTGMPGTSCHDRERSLRDADDEVGPPHASARTTPPSSPQSGIVDGIHRAESWLTDAASSSTVVPDSAFLVYGANGNNEPATAEVYSAEPDSENGPFTAEGDAAECCSLSFSPTFFSTRCVASLPLNLNAEDLALIDTARQLEQELVAERTLHSQSCAASSAALLDNEDAEGLIVKQSAPFLAWNSDCDRDDGDDDAPPSLRRECEREEGGAGAAGGAGEGGRSSSFRIVGARGQRGTDAAVTPPARLHTLDGDDREKQQALQQALRRAMRYAERALGSRGDEEMLANDDGGQEHHNGAVDTTCDVRNVKGHRQHEDSAQYHKEHYGGGWSAEVGSRVSYGNNDVVRLAERTLGSRGYEDKHAYEDGGQEYSNGIMTTNGMRHQLCSRQHENSDQSRTEHGGEGQTQPGSRVPYRNNFVVRHAKQRLCSHSDEAEEHDDENGQQQRDGVRATHNAQTAESASESRVRGLKECNGAARNVQHSCGARVGGSLLSTPQVEESMLPFKERKVAPQCGAKVAGTPATFTTYQDGLVPERHKQPCVSGAVALQRMNNLAASALALLQATKES